MSSATPSPTLSMPRGRLSPPWMLSMPSRGRDAPSMDLEAKLSLPLCLMDNQQPALFRANIPLTKNDTLLRLALSSCQPLLSFNSFGQKTKRKKEMFQGGNIELTLSVLKCRCLLLLVYLLKWEHIS